MARMTGSFVSALSYSVWGSASGAPADGAAGCEMGEARCACSGGRAAYASRLPHLASRASYDPINQRAQKHDDAHQSVGAEEGGI